MRILASNPDTLGDLILRQPMYRAMLDAGHELTLIVRPAVVPLVRHVAPGARIIEIPYEVYAHDLPDHWHRFNQLFDAARASVPNAYIVAPYRWTLFDERLADELPGVKRFGLSGHLYHGDPHQGRAAQSSMRFDVVAEVCEDAREVEKNAALAAAVLGGSTPRKLPDPRLDVTPAHRESAATILSRLGLAGGEYWIACVTGTANVALKAWHRQRWAQTLSQWANSRGRQFLFVGLATEEADVRAVVEAMDDAAAKRTRVWMPPGGTIDDLIGLAALSAGYVGHDTGPMHLAAAVGKPVLAVFGGGHKLRFAPAADPSVTVTVGVSCRGCQWVCSFAESHCVKDVPADEVLRAANDLEDRRVSGREARVLEPSRALQEQMIGESAAIAQERLRAAAELTRQLRTNAAAWQLDVKSLVEEADARTREAVAHAHAELGGQLREKESVIQQQDEQLRGKESLIREQHSQLSQKDTALRERQALLEEQAENQSALTAQLESRASELSRLQAEFEEKSREASQLASTVGAQRGEIDRLRSDISAKLAQIEQATREGQEAAQKQSDELGKLREHLQAVEDRVRQVEQARRPRRPLKQVLVDFVIGPQHYYPPPPKSLPGITVVTIVQNAEDSIRDTIESVIGQTHAHVQYVVIDRGSTDRTGEILEQYRDRIDRIVTEPAEVSALDALGKGYALATYDVLSRLDPGDVYEPGALTRVSEYFRDHPNHKAAVFQDGLARCGWRFSTEPQRTPDVYELLARGADVPGGVFVTSNAYKSLDGLNRERGHAAEWDFLLRLARRYGIHSSSRHVRTIRPRAVTRSSDDLARASDFQTARALFRSSFGWPGRARCAVIFALNRLGDALRRKSPHRLFFPLAAPAGRPPEGTLPASVPSDQPVCPLDGRMPDRLLFSTRDSVGGDRAIGYIYYDHSADAALAYPPIDLETLESMYFRKGQRENAIVPPDPAEHSPFAGFQGRSSLARLLAHVRSPYWWFARPDFSDRRAAELFETLAGRIPHRGVTARFLNVACFEGGVLDVLKQHTDWSLFGIETNPDAARAARAKGYTIWETSAQDAAFVIPVDQQFDVIYLGGLFEHLPDPLLVLRRLRQMLAPGGRIVIDTPNLDSKLLDRFGPTWSHWRAPYHRTLIGRRGLRAMARAGGFRIERLRTRTHPLAVVRSVQLNDLGLGAVVPDTAQFPPDVASRGVLLAGWARLLWDWRGRGDYLYAVLRAEE